MIASYTQVMIGYIQGTGMKYDLMWDGKTIINGKKFNFKTIDLTDYETMNDTCPCCSKDEPSDDDYNKCHCESYKEIICILNKNKLS